LPDVKRLYEKYKNDPRLVFLTISIAQVSSLEFLKNVVQTNNIEFPVLSDPDWISSETYSASGIPTTFYIDREGLVRGIWYGEATLADFEAGLAKILAK
jgi:peroxiredoxin